MRKILSTAVMATLMSGALSVQAYEEGDWIVRVGAVTVAPNESSDDIVLPTNPPTVLKGASVGSPTWVYNVGFAYRF